MHCPPSTIPTLLLGGPFNRGLIQAFRVKATTELPHDWAQMLQTWTLGRRGIVIPPSKQGAK